MYKVGGYTGIGCNVTTIYFASKTLDHSNWVEFMLGLATNMYDMILQPTASTTISIRC